jgi:ABC-type nitrate/sulfonate/bicarbonate transport system permease component
MSATSGSDAGAVAGTSPVGTTAATAAARPLSLWERRGFYRYGFMALILAVWELTGPFVDPIFFTYPSKIAAAFIELTLSGELPHFLGQSLEVMFYGLLSAVVVGIPLGVATARIRKLDWALDLPINAL